MTRHLYLDHNATSPLRPAVAVELSRHWHLPLNPSSVHYFGQRAQQLVEASRATITAATGCNHVIFTSGGTEANNLALHLLLQEQMAQTGKPCRLLFFGGEHPSVQAYADNMARTADDNTNSITYKPNHMARPLPILSNGLADLDALTTTLKEINHHDKHHGHYGGTVVALQAVNHESGVMQPISTVATLCHQHGALLMVDGIQAFAHQKIDLGLWGAAAATMASHKLGGLHGAGAVLLMTKPTLSPLLWGGGQEGGYRPGTVNSLAIHSMGLALSACLTEITTRQPLYDTWQKKLEQGVQAIRPTLQVVGATAPRLPHVSWLVDSTISGQEMVLALDLMGVAVSSGAACSSGKVGPSATLRAMGFDDRASRNTLRISFGFDNTESDVNVFLEAYRTIIARQTL